MITMEAIKSSVQADKGLNDDLRNRLLSDLENVFITDQLADLAQAVDALIKIAQQLPNGSAKKLIYQKIKELADEIISKIELEELEELKGLESGLNDSKDSNNSPDDGLSL